MASRTVPGKLCRIYACFLLICLSVHVCHGKEDKEEDNPGEKWKKKDVRDYTDADLERLFEKWEDADEPLEEDELPEWKRPQPKIDLSNLDANDPEGMLKMTKKGKTLMMFATVSGKPTEKETEQITQLWQSSLFNANIELQRYIVGDNRALFMVKDGSMAWPVKDFLIQQDRCELVTIEGKDYPGRGAPKGDPTSDEKKTDSDKKKKKQKQKQKQKKNRDPKENETVKTDNNDNKKPTKKDEL